MLGFVGRLSRLFGRFDLCGLAALWNAKIQYRLEIFVVQDLSVP